MRLLLLPGPHGHGTDIVRHGQTWQGTHRDRCRARSWARRPCLPDSHAPGLAPGVQEPMVAMARNTSGLRATARGWHVRTNPVRPDRNQRCLRATREQGLHPEQGAVELGRSAAWERRRGRISARDAMGASVAQQSQPRGHGPAMDPQRGTGGADGGGRRQDEGGLRGHELWQPCGIPPFDLDGWGAYARHLEPAQPQGGQASTQNMASKPLHLRPRIKRLGRRTSGFSQAADLHDLVLGLCINRDGFGHPIEGKSTPVRHLQKREPPC